MIKVMEEAASENKSKNYSKRPLWQWIVIYFVLAVVVYAAIYYLFLSKKTSYNNTYTQTQTQSPTQQQTASSPTTAMMSDEMTVPLATENKSGESGTATLKEENGKVTVTLDLTGFTKGIQQPAHIHIGACPGVGAVKYPLTSVIDGKSVTIISVTLAQLKQELPLAINVHKSINDITNYTACGPLSK